MKNLVICCDGTWNEPTQKDRGRVVPSNVVKMTRAIDLSERNLEEHLRGKPYYHAGVGTNGWLDRVTGGALGIGLSANILHAYEHIATHYENHDRLFIFGFSRGAYTARSLTGLLGMCGLVKKGDRRGIERANELYRDSVTDEGRTRAENFKNSQRQPRVHFLGVWDTVGALGVPAFSRYGLARKLVRTLARGSKYAHGFHHTELGDQIDHAYHALAIDERRGPFEPSVWKATRKDRANVRQVWFAGVHCNVGGGYADTGLSDHALMWMAWKAHKAGLKLDFTYLRMRVDPNAHGELRNSMSPPYQVIPKCVRKIGTAKMLNEFVHYSVLERHEQPTDSYAPRSLLEALEAGNVQVEYDGKDLVQGLRSAIPVTPPGSERPVMMSQAVQAHQRRRRDGTHSSRPPKTVSQPPAEGDRI